MKVVKKNMLAKVFAIVSSVFFIASITMIIVAKEFAFFNYTLLSIALFFLFCFFVIARKELLRFLSSSLFKNIARELTTISLVLLILGLVNYLSFKNNKELDLTKYKLHTLSEQTVDILNSFGKEELDFVLFSKRSDWSRYLNLVDMYKKAKPGISLRVIDTDSEPALVALNKVTANGTMLIRYKKKEYRTVLKDELSLTNALMRISQKKNQILYFSTGHSETKLTDETQEGLSYLSSVLRNASYKMGVIPLDNNMPEDVEMLIVVNPRVDFSETEISLLESYLKRGGHLFLTLAPRFDGTKLINLERFLKEKGVEFVNGIVLDRLSASSGGQASIAMIDSYSQENAITKGFKGKTLFPVSSFFKASDEAAYHWQPVINSTPFPATWGEVNFSEVESGRATYSPSKDFKGPLAIITLGVSKTNKSKILVSGSSTFIANQFQGQANNFNFFLNSIGWMSDEKSIKSLNRPKLKGNLVYVSDIHFGLIFYVVILFFPFVFFGLSLFFYKRKLSL